MAAAAGHRPLDDHHLMLAFPLMRRLVTVKHFTGIVCRVDLRDHYTSTACSWQFTADLTTSRLF